MRATIVYGFLGAGKTTLLRSLVPRLAAVESTALLVNEFGIEGVDQVVLASDDLTVRQLLGGCCAAKCAVICWSRWTKSTVPFGPSGW